MEWPTLFSCCAADKPAGPEPTMAIFLLVLLLGITGFIQPDSIPLSAIANSRFLMVTGVSVMPKTQAPSHTAGQTLPVTSGKLLVFIKR